jgi:ATP-dependent Clp protease protease subunit
MQHQRKRGTTIARKNLYLIGRVEDANARELIASLLEEPNTEFTLFINSEGGSVYNELAICNAVALHGKVDTVCLGVALSAAASILAAGRRRFVMSNAVAMIHQVSWEMGWQPSSNLAKNSRFLEQLNLQLTEFISARSGQPLAKVRADVAEDFYLFGEDIIRYGLADALWESSRRLAPPKPTRSSRKHTRRKPRRPAVRAHD